MTTNEDFLFAQEALALGYVTEAQVEEARVLQRRMAEELHLDERLGVLLVKRGWLAEDQARRVDARTRSASGTPGEIVGYRLLDVVGRGAMGTVYRALHLGLNREVAIKILRQDLAGDRTQIERLKAEASTLASLDHPNIVRALDAGESNGFPYVVMEYVEGETLRDRLRREGRLPEKEALTITRALADALERARRMGVVHRDVKPGNILLTRAGEPKLMDLGLAKGPIDMGLTQHGATVGTPQYIAPEQAVDPRKADTRSDIYSLGATLYAMLAGRPPFDGETLAEILTKVLYESPTPVRVLRPEVSAETGYLVDRMMLRDPSLRYRTPAQVVADIDRLEHGASILPPGFSGNWEAFLLRRRVRRTAILGGGTIALAILTALGVKLGVDLWNRGEERDRVETEIGLLPADLSPTAGRPEVEGRLAEAERLLVRARETEPASLAQLERRVRALREEQRRWQALEASARDRVEPAVEAGRYADAVAAYDELFKKDLAVWGPAQNAFKELLSGVRQRSDDALDEHRRRAFASDPRDLADLLGTLERWSAELAWRFAPTARLREERQRAQDALDAARALDRELGQGLLALDDAWLSSGLSTLRLAGLRSDERARRARVLTELAAQRPALVVNPRYVTPPRLEELVKSPFDARLREVEDAVERAWKDVAAQAERLAAAGDPKGGMAALEAFAAAAGADGEFPAQAQAARAALDDLGSRTRDERQSAASLLDEVVSKVVASLRKGDPKAAAAAVDEALAKGLAVRTVSRELEAMTRIPALYDLFLERALAGLEARVGPEEKRWIDALAFRGGTVERRAEIVEVSRAGRTFVLVSHRGNSTGPRVPKALVDLELADLERLAGLSSEVPEEAAAAALHAFSTLPAASEDVPGDMRAHRALRDRLERAGPALAPLLAWAQRTTRELSDEVERLELRAADHFAQGQGHLAKGRYDLAEFHLLGKLLAPPLSFTSFVRTHDKQIRADLAGLAGKKDAESLKRLLVGVDIPRNEPRPDGGIDVDLLFTFDMHEQLENFTGGWARLVGSNAGTVVTPGTVDADLSLLLHPGSDGEVTKDRPLVLPTCFDPAFEMSMQFTLAGNGGVPLFLGIDLDGVQVGILSADPQRHPFPPDVPRLDGDGTAPPRYDVYGRGRGVIFRAEKDFGDPARWAWPDGNQGRHFVPPEISKKGRKEKLDQEWFAFENRDKDYRVKFTRHPVSGVRLEINGQEVASASGEPFRSARPDGKIQLLTFTPCRIDDLQLTGRISASWLARRKSALPSTEPRPPK